MTQGPTTMRSPAEAVATDAIRSPEQARVSRAIETLSERLLTADSATAVLEAWCVERGFPGMPPIRACPVPGPERAATAIQRDRLGVGPDEPVRYRRVRLAFGGLPLSEAENWYVPARLTPAMNAMLSETHAPFGHVVQDLMPRRRNLARHALRPHSGTWPGRGEALFAIDAVLANPEGIPFCEVAEVYLGAVLGPDLVGGGLAEPGIPD